MGCCPDMSTVLVAVAVIAVSIYYLSKYMSGGKCKSKARLDGKTVIITGANAGIGKETARDLAKRGAHVIMACRNMERGTAAAKELRADTKGDLVARQLDLTSFKSIRKFAEQINSNEARLDILINNAGLVCAKSTTEDGIDTQFCSNHLGHFLLTNLLMDKLKASAPSRIVSVSSLAHMGGTMDWDDLNMEKPGSYNVNWMYARTKLANVLFTRELAKRLKGTGVTSYALHPGAVISDFQKDMSEKSVPYIFVLAVNFAIQFLPFLWKNVQQGAQTSIYCAVAEELADQSGLYYSDCAPKKPAARALNADDAKKLWDVSLKMCGLEKNKNESDV